MENESTEKKATKARPSFSSESKESESYSGFVSSCFGNKQSLKAPNLCSSSTAFKQAAFLAASIESCGELTI